MLIDDSSKIARLSNSIAGIDQLQPIYYFIWFKFISMQEKILTVNSDMYYMNGKINYN